jgi:DNA-binding PadR family transcriptional regulator
MSYYGLNSVKPKEILDDMVKKELINRVEENWGSKVIINYKVSERGRLTLNEILALYEELVLRKFLVSPNQFSS